MFSKKLELIQNSFLFTKKRNLICRSLNRLSINHWLKDFFYIWRDKYWKLKLSVLRAFGNWKTHFGPSPWNSKLIECEYLPYESLIFILIQVYHKMYIFNWSTNFSKKWISNFPIILLLLFFFSGKNVLLIWTKI